MSQNSALCLNKKIPTFIVKYFSERIFHFLLQNRKISQIKPSLSKVEYIFFVKKFL